MSSRIEDILQATIDGAPYNEHALSRIEELLIELKEVIEAGGGGGGTTNYNALSNKPQIEGIELSGNKTASDLFLATKAETDALLADKADLSILQPMTQAQYDALVTKTAPLYFIYEDGEST